MIAQDLDTQRNLAMDFVGTRERISMSRSTGIGFDDCASCRKNCSFNIFLRGMDFATLENIVRRVCELYKLIDFEDSAQLFGVTYTAMRLPFYFNLKL